MCGSRVLRDNAGSAGKGRIALITPDIVGPVKNGGIGTACFHYARTLANDGYRVDILFSGEVEEKARRYWTSWYAERQIVFLTLDDVPNGNVTTYGLRWATARALRIMSFLRTRDYDYLIFQDWHANGFWTARAPAGRWICRYPNRPDHSFSEPMAKRWDAEFRR